MCDERFEAKRRDFYISGSLFLCVFYACIKRKVLQLSAKKKIARNHQKRSRLFLLFVVCVRYTN